MEFGGLSLSGYGAYQMQTGATDLTNVTDAGTGTASGYSLTSGGVVTPTSNGSLSAQNGNTIDVNSDQGSFTFTFDIIDNCYSVADIDELIFVMEGALTYGTHSIRCRGGDYNPGMANTKSCRRTTAISGTLVNDPDNVGTSTHIQITPHTGETPKIWRLNINGTDIAENGFDFYQMTFRSPKDVIVAGVSYDGISLQGFGSNAPTDVWVRYCFGGIEGGYEVGDDPYSFIEGLGARALIEENFCSGCYDFVKLSGADCVVRNNFCRGCTNDGYKFSDTPRLLHEGDEVTDKTVRYEEYTIGGVTRGTTTTVTFTQTETNNPSSSNTYYIRGSGLAWLDGKWLGSQILSATTTSIEINYNSTGDTDWVSGGVARRGLGSHGDFVQVLGGSSDGQRDDMTFRGLVFTHGEGVQDFTDGQGIYFQSPSGGALIRNLLIDGCVINSNTANGILMNRVVSATVRNCVVVRNHTSDLGAGEVSTKINMGAENIYDNILVIDTITNGYVWTPVITNSTMNLDQTSIPDYEAMFDGPIPASGSQEQYDGWVIYQTKTGGPGDTSPVRGISGFDRTGLGYSGTIPGRTTAPLQTLPSGSVSATVTVP